MSEAIYPSVKDLTLEEKASLTSGGDAWHLQGVESKGIPSYMITDGPHGLRKSLASSAGETDLDDSVPATCFPPAAGLSSSWNPELIHKVGEAMAEECIQEKVAVILGPGVNIKRNPLGGRCFEYWSEDPYLAGHEAIGIVEGVQSKGVGTSLKHFAANNQETDRLRVDARISPRALRDEWGFDGIVMSDWGADHDRGASLNAGLNLEMPPSYTDDQIVYAVRDGLITPAQLDRMAQGMIDLVNKTRAAMSIDNYRFDVDAHDEVAHQAAIESIVMLKNDDAILPLNAGPVANPSATPQKIAVIGEFARTPRYQGGGSSHITPTKMTSFLDTLAERGIKADFAPGFTLDLEPADPALESEAVETAKNADVVLMFLGLPEAVESEGFDRDTLDMPAKQIALLEQVAAANQNVVVVLSNGSVITVAPWAKNAKGILESWLLGQSGGPALADVIFGQVSPSGKLAQSIPLDINDDPSMLNWPGEEGHVDYGEGVFVGYRYYDTYGKAVDYPFGYGLSYATFEITGVAVAKTGANTATVTATVTNTSDVDAAETVQVYVVPGKADVARPKHELKGFTKVFLKAGESKTVAIDLDERAFAYWSEKYNDWHVEAGEYAIEVGVSSRDIADTVAVALDGDGKTQPLTEWSTYGEWEADPFGAKIVAAVAAAGEAGELTKLPDNAMMRMFLNPMPINSLPTLLGEGGKKIAQFMLDEYAKLSK